MYKDVFSNYTIVCYPSKKIKLRKGEVLYATDEMCILLWKEYDMQKNPSEFLLRSNHIVKQ